MKTRLATPTWTIVVTALVLVFAALAAAGCGSSSGDAGDGTVALDGTSWSLTGWSLSSLDPADFTITADFADGGIGGKSAVNTYRGSYETGHDAAFSVGEIASTMMAGPEPEMRAEKAYLTLLAEAASCSREGDTLTLYDKGGNESLIFAATGQ